MQKRVIATFVAVVVSAALLAPAAAEARRQYRRRATAQPVVHKAPPAWNYMAQRMRPPKSTKWKAKWNNLGMSGWELVGVSENMFIFKRAADWSGAVASSAPTAPAASAPAASSTSAAPAPKAVTKGGRFAPPPSEGAASAPSSESRFKSRFGR